MNWKRVGIAGGALATFVVGVSIVAYTTGSFVSQADEVTGIDTSSSDTFSPTSDLTGVPVESPSSSATSAAATGSVVNLNGSPLQTSSASSQATGSGQLGAIKPADPIKITSQIGKSFSSLDDILKIGVPKLLINLAGLVMMVMFFINAIKLLFNAGNESGVKDAKVGMLNAGIGFAIVLLAYAIVAFINGIFK